MHILAHLTCSSSNYIIKVLLMSQSSIPSKDASKSPIPSEITTETDSITESDPGDSGSVFKAPRASQAISQ